MLWNFHIALNKHKTWGGTISHQVITKYTCSPLLNYKIIYKGTNRWTLSKFPDFYLTKLQFFLARPYTTNPYIIHLVLATKYL